MNWKAFIGTNAALFGVIAGANCSTTYVTNNIIAGDGATGSDGPGSMSDAAADGAVDDATDDMSSAMDMGVGVDAGLCSPTNSNGFASMGLHAMNGHQTLCSDQQISDFYSKCYDPVTSTMAACSAFTMIGANKSCIGCLETPAQAKSWGAMVDVSGIPAPRINVPGCLLITGHAACAQAYQDMEDCADYGAECIYNCPITDQASFDLYNQCFVDAEAGTCKSWVNKMNAACKTNNDASVSAVCTDHATFADFYAAIAPVFCK